MCFLFGKKQHRTEEQKSKACAARLYQNDIKLTFIHVPLCFVILKAFSICGSNYPACTQIELVSRHCIINEEPYGLVRRVWNLVLQALQVT